MLGLAGLSPDSLALSQIVVTDETPGKQTSLYRWMRFRALAASYAAALHRTTSDRYVERQQFYEDQAKNEWKNVMRDGVNYVVAPLPRPGASHERGGFFGTANVSDAGGTGGDTPLTVAVSYLAGTVESELSDSVTIGAKTGGTVTITKDNLTPPDGTTGSDGVARLAATHYGLYANVFGFWRRQALVAIDQASGSFTVPATAAGTPHYGGQLPQARYAFGASALRA
jgi:hypothetical protein